MPRERRFAEATLADASGRAVQYPDRVRRGALRCIWLLIIKLTAGCVPAAPPGARDAGTAALPEREYGGPLGLPWGLQRGEAKALLARKLTLGAERELTGGLSTQEYTGLFQSHETERIDVRFCNGQLAQVEAVIRLKSGEQVYRTWQALVNESVRSFGAPSTARETVTSREPDPGPGSVTEAAWLWRIEHELTSGSVLERAWNFRRQVFVELKASATAGQPVQVVWTSGARPLLAACLDVTGQP